MNRKSRKAPSGFDPSAIDLPDWLERFDWVRWCKDRAARGKKLTEEAVRLQLRYLDDLRHQGHSPASVIDHSIANGYQGLFAPKGTTPTGTAAKRFDPVAYLNNRDRGIADDDHRTIDV